MSPTSITRYELSATDRIIIDALTDIRLINASNTNLVQTKKRNLKAMIQRTLKEMEDRAVEPGWEARLVDMKEKWQELVDEFSTAKADRISEPLLPGKRE
jgi:hypothetical protein